MSVNELESSNIPLLFKEYPQLSCVQPSNRKKRFGNACSGAVFPSFSTRGKGWFVKSRVAAPYECREASACQKVRFANIHMVASRLY